MSTDEYVPSEDLMRTAWHQYATATDAQYARLRGDNENSSAEFDRFLARVRRDAAREALDGLRDTAIGLTHACDAQGDAESAATYSAIASATVSYKHAQHPEETP